MYPVYRVIEWSGFYSGKDIIEALKLVAGENYHSEYIEGDMIYGSWSSNHNQDVAVFGLTTDHNGVHLECDWQYPGLVVLHFRWEWQKQHPWRVFAFNSELINHEVDMFAEKLRNQLDC